MTASTDTPAFWRIAGASPFSWSSSDISDVFGVDLLVVEPGREFLRAGECFAGLLGELVQVHMWFLLPGLLREWVEAGVAR